MAIKEVTLHVPARTVFDPETGQGHVHFTIDPATVRDTDTGEQIGTIAGCLGGGVEIAVGEGFENVWAIEARDLWQALQDALRESETPAPAPEPCYRLAGKLGPWARRGMEGERYLAVGPQLTPTYRRIADTCKADDGTWRYVRVRLEGEDEYNHHGCGTNVYERGGDHA
jgi:hypothetical protein